MTGDRNRVLRWAAGSIIVGLALESLTLLGSHPTAFLAFILGGGTFVGLGIALYVVALFGSEPTGR